jgi:transposase
LDERTLPHDPEAVARAVSRWPRVRCCYEAGPTGYGLARQLRARGIACDVVAPGLVPVRPGDRVKTDPRDARKLAWLHAGGLLEAITVPSEQVEALRDLVRQRYARPGPGRRGRADSRARPRPLPLTSVAAEISASGELLSAGCRSVVPHGPA